MNIKIPRFPTQLMVLLIAASTALVLTSPANAEEPPPLPTVDQVMNYMDDLYRSNSSYARMKMTVVTENFSRTMEMESWSKGEDLGLVVIRSPAKEAGSSTLRTDEGLWSYGPRTDKLLRIPSGLLADSWMGSHFSNDDLMRESSWQDDFDTTLEWVKESGDWVLVTTSIPKDEAVVVYTKIVGYLRAKDYIPLRQEFYDGEDVVRTMKFSDIQDIDGKPVPMKMLLIPADDPEESTSVEYIEFKFNIDIKDSLFTLRGLRKKAGRKR